MRPLLGDFLAAASGHIGAATGDRCLGPHHRRLLPAMTEHGNWLRSALTSWSPRPAVAANRDQAQQPGASGVTDGCANGLVVSDESALLKDAALICKTATARGERLTQRALARTLRGRGHRFPNQSLRDIALAVGLGHSPGQLPADGGWRS